MTSPILFHEGNQKLRALTAIGDLLRGTKCGHCSYPTVLELLKWALALPPAYQLSPKEREEFLKLKQRVWVEANKVNNNKIYRDDYSICIKCSNYGLMDIQVLMAAIGKVLQVLDYALNMPVFVHRY